MLNEDALMKKYNDFLKPTAKIFLNDKDIANIEGMEIYLGNITVSNSISSKADSFNFSISALDTLSGKIQTELLNKFAPGNDVEIRIGYGENLTTLIMGTITDISFSYNESGSEITVSGMDDSFKFMKDKKPMRKFIGKYISDIVTTVLKDYSLKKDIDKTDMEEPEIIRNNESDYQFIKKLANKVDYDFYIKNKTIYFKKPAVKEEPILKLEYGESLYSYSLKYNSPGVYSKVTVRGMDENKKNFEASVESNKIKASFKEFTNDKSISKVTNAELNEYNSEIKSEKEALKRAEILMKQKSENYISGSIDCAGIPDLIPGKFIELDGIGDGLNCQYYITDVRHTFNDQGYTSQADFKSNNSDENPLDGSGEANQYENINKKSNILIGKVTNIKDPENLGRVQVRLPNGKEDAVTDWAKVASFIAGKEFGGFFIPDIDDMVVVAFNDGNIECPIVIGRLWNNKDKPPISVDKDGKNNIDIIKTKGGNQITFENEGSKEKIIINTKAGEGIILDNGKKVNISDSSGKNTLTMDVSKNSIEINAGMKILIKSGGNKILIDAQSNTVSVESGVSLKLKAQMIQIEAGASMDIKSNGVLNIKGAITKIN